MNVGNIIDTASRVVFVLGAIFYIIKNSLKLLYLIKTFHNYYKKKNDPIEGKNVTVELIKKPCLGFNPDSDSFKETLHERLEKFNEGEKEISNLWKNFLSSVVELW